MARMLAVLSLLLVVFDFGEPCCMPTTFTTQFNMTMHLSAKKRGQEVQIEAIIPSGKIVVDGPNTDVYMSANGRMAVAVQGMVIPASVELEVGLDNGESLWAKVVASVPGMGRKEVCHYLDIVGDIPSGYNCYLNSLTQLDDAPSGQRVYQMEVKKKDGTVVLTDIVTVDNNCVPVFEVATANANGVSLYVLGTYYDGRVGEVDVVRNRRPLGCNKKDTITIPPPTDGGPQALVKEEISVLSSRRRRRSARAEGTLQRFAREALESSLQDLLP